MPDTSEDNLLCRWGHALRHRMSHALRHRMSMASDLGQTAIVAVLSITVVVSLLGMVLVNTVDQSFSLQQTKSVQIYANRALEAGENAYLTAINANPSLAQCSVSQNGSGTCGGLNYGQWNVVENSATSGADAEYYAFGNPQPTFDPTSNTLVSLSVQIVGAAHDASATNGYLFDQETLTVTPKNGFLKNVWWSNYESYSSTGNYSTCSYNWATQPTTYNIANQGADCSPVYFGPNDYLFGPVFTNDSVFVSGSGKTADSPSFGTPTSPSPVTTADPNCLFVDSTHGMTGSDSNCSSATGDVALFSPTTASDPSSSGNPVEQPPSTDAQLGTIANQNGCLYSGPTQIKLSTSNGVGQMTVISPDTPEETVAGLGYQFDENNLSDIATGAPINTNNCPNDGTAPLPSNGVVFVENATAAQSQAWANPFDDPLSNTVTNVTSTPSSPAANASVTLTAKVTSASSQLNTGATVAFSQATCRNVNGSTCQSWNTAQTINNCSAAALSTPTAVTPATTPATYVSTATCTATESSKVGDTFSAAYSGGTYAKSSSANVGQTYTLTPSTTYGPDAQVTAGGCASCYYGETSSPDSEGDAFVSGSLSGQLTIGTANDVIVDGSITYADCSSTWTTGQSGFSAPSEGFCPYSPGGTNDSLGLIAYNYAEINRPLLASSTGNGNTPTVLSYCGSSPPPNCDPSNGTNGITIDAAILALTQSFVVNNYADGGTEGPLIVYGSVQQFAAWPGGDLHREQQLWQHHLHAELRVPEELHVGPAARLRVATQLPRAVNCLVGPAVGDHQCRGGLCQRVPAAAGGVLGLECAGRAADGTRSDPVLFADNGWASQLPDQHGPIAPHHRDGDGQRQRDGHFDLDRSCLQRWIGHHQLHGEPEPALLHLHRCHRHWRHGHVGHGQWHRSGHLVHLRGDSDQRQRHQQPVEPLQFGRRPGSSGRAHQRVGRGQYQRFDRRELDRSGR